MMRSNDFIDMKACRICLLRNKRMCPIFKYQFPGNYSEMLTTITDIKVIKNDGLPDKICGKCCTVLEKAYLLRKIAERSDKKLRNILSKQTSAKQFAIDSLKDDKCKFESLNSEVEIKQENEIDDHAENTKGNFDGSELTSTVMANTEMKENNNSSKFSSDDTKDQFSLKPARTLSKPDYESIFSDDEFFQGDDIDDEDYVPPCEKTTDNKNALHLDERKKQPPSNKLKISNKIIYVKHKNDKQDMITCYPILKNGSRGPPILISKPKSGSIIKVKKSLFKAKTNKKTEMILKEIKVRPVKEKEKTVCPICGFLTNTLHAHLKTHEEKNYQCPDCPKSFSRKLSYQVHIKQHQGIRDHVCNVCGAGFCSRKTLVRHEMVHKGVKPFQCDICSRKFYVNCDLTRHLQGHAGHKPFKCETCGAVFSAKSHLKCHVRMHTGERPYSCEVCNVTFTYKVNLNNHVIKMHGVNLKYKSIYTVTEEILNQERKSANEAKTAVANIVTHLTNNVPAPAAHETVYCSD